MLCGDATAGAAEGRGAAMARVTDRSRTARARLLVSLAMTLTVLLYTVVCQLAHSGYTALGLGLTGIGIFTTTWFLLDVGISWQQDLQRRRVPQQARRR